MKKSTLNLVAMALFIALSVVGAQIKVMGSVAFDALPAFLAAFLMGPLAGAVVGAIGHIVSALFAGFPLTLPLHIAIALEMAAICAFVGWLSTDKNMNLILAGIIAFVLNAVLAPVILVFWPGFGMAVALAYFGPLAIAAGFNVVFAVILAYALIKPYGKMIKA